MKNLLGKIVGGMTMLYTLAMARVVYAAPPELTPTNIPEGGGLDLPGVERLISNIGRYLIEIGVALAVIFIVWGGISYMLAGGNEEKSKAARGRIWNGIIGAAIVIGVGVIIMTLLRVIPQIGTGNL
ncbi:MAG: hypothetical protein A3A33_04990 [Candidatus Yanofskybacteria bacterium RIFCSPLOWO2_01_FULL_49_25]|uniref:Uncharacterized protein n=1 Tax=Candidatus Yanofskybacteria bacterium RIFCSPLOWO2_01_FULL_49_25 TaxID=1802701 RepID=A0A1F8GSC2_9BACT|nr:MAG: hypothetical protein A3A33_04990 [Candidatus Yanofskybacteria bacterium RIFCSPLOWO2_01_FULL_49_25]